MYHPSEPLGRSLATHGAVDTDEVVPDGVQGDHVAMVLEFLAVRFRQARVVAHSLARQPPSSTAASVMTLFTRFECQILGGRADLLARGSNRRG